ncbi:MAG: potassium channel protein [Bryobacter sp.]|nr:potassium channel protein [Bryobacter sp.]
MLALPSRIAKLAALIAATILFGAAGFTLIADYPFFDALYMAIMTMTTIGYGEIRPLGQAGRAFNLFYMLLSVSVLLLTLGVITQSIVEAQFAGFFGRRRARKMIDSLNGHYIVCGFGRVGRGAAAALHAAGKKVVVLDRREDRVDWAMNNGYIGLFGDSTRDEVLRDAGIARAEGLIAALSTDADNLFAVISAKALNPNVRVGARAAEEEAERKMRQVGADSVFAPYTMTGSRLAQSLMKPHVNQFLDFATTSPDLNVRIEQIQVAGASELAGRTLAEMRFRSEMQVIVLAIRRAAGEMLFNPAADSRVESLDYLIVMGEPEPLRRLELRAAGGA